jgi:MYXO-CTERM domain-containing protein
MTKQRLATLLLSLLVLGAVLFPARHAQAAGTVQISTREPVEEDGKWKLKFTINNGAVPNLPHMPVLFVFTATMHYERALTDKTGDKPVLNRIPLSNQQPINESLDVGFSDATGKIFSKTAFDFVIRRDRGFEAGEYDLKIKREGDGVQLGQNIHLVLKGDNPVIDRRAIVFAGDKKKKVDPDKASAGGDKPADADKKADAPAEPAAGGDAPPAEAPAPPAVEPKQGGCGCRVAGDTDGGAPLALAIAGVAAVVLARRRRRTAPAAPSSCR